MVGQRNQLFGLLHLLKKGGEPTARQVMPDSLTGAEETKS